MGDRATIDHSDPRKILLSPGVRVTLGAVLISFSAVFVKLARVDPTSISFYRVLFGSVFLAAILAVGKRKPNAKLKPLAMLAFC